MKWYTRYWHFRRYRIYAASRSDARAIFNQWKKLGHGYRRSSLVRRA